MPLRSVQTVRIVKLYKPLSQIRSENILSVLNEMQFTDRIRTEKGLYDLYRPYGLFSDRISLSILDMSGNEMRNLTFNFGLRFKKKQHFLLI